MASSQEDEFRMKNGVRYIPFGVDSHKDIPTSCPRCGGSYKGELQRLCPYCASLRKGCMIEVLESSPTDRQAQEPIILLPSSLPREVRVGTGGKRAWLQADKVICEKGVKVTLVEASQIQLGEQNNVVTALARLTMSTLWGLTSFVVYSPEFTSDGGLDAKILITQRFLLEDRVNIGTMVVLPGGSGSIGTDSQIGHLLIGEQSGKIHLARNSAINMLSAISGAEISSGPDAIIKEEIRISREEFASSVQAMLQPATAKQTRISAPR